MQKESVKGQLRFRSYWWAVRDLDSLIKLLVTIQALSSPSHPAPLLPAFFLPASNQLQRLSLLGQLAVRMSDIGGLIIIHYEEKVLKET